MTGNQALVLLASYLAIKVPFLGKAATPTALNFARFAVVIVLRIW